MTLSALLRQSVTWTTTPDATADAEGNWVPGTPVTTTEPCYLQPLTAAEIFDQGTDRTASRYNLFLLPTSTATARSTGIIDGLRYQVDGKPALMTTPRGPHHVEVVVSRRDE